MRPSASRSRWLALFLAVPLCALGADLSGLVRDNQGNSLTGLTINASIYFAEGSTQRVAVTDSAGRFAISDGPGWWMIDVPADQLNSRGYFGISGPSLVVTGQSVVRLTTRRLDFTHRIDGRLVDESGQPLTGYSLRARIWENNALFETNLVTAANGTFRIAATPAVWSLCCLEPAPGSMAENVFGERLVEVEVTNAEKQVTLVAPAATSTISVTVSNLGSSELIASTEAFGAKYRLTQALQCGLDSTVAFHVFNGVWTLSVTNDGLCRPTPPPPVSVAVTNGLVSVVLASVAQSSPTQLVQRVRTLTAGGVTVSNASVSANSETTFLPPSPPQVLGFGEPGVFELALAEGRWRLAASTANAPDWIGWQVSSEVKIVSNAAPSDVTLVFPESDAGPQIFGTVRSPGGSGLPSQWISLRMKESGTNYSTSVLTDSLGRFGVHVLPGRWQLQAYAGVCPLSSEVVVSNQDAQADFNLWLPAPGSGLRILVNVSTGDEDDAARPESWLYLQSGVDYVTTNASSAGLDLFLRPGIWHASIQTPYYVGGSASYTLFPSFTWQVSEGGQTNLFLPTRQATARIEGRLRDDHGNLLLNGYATAWTSINGTNFWVSGVIASGYFSLNVFPGQWQVGAGVSAYPSVGAAENAVLAYPVRPGGAQATSHYYTVPAPLWIDFSNDLVRCDFTTTNVPLQPVVALSVAVIREDGGDLSGMDVFSSSLDVGQTRFTDGHGVASFAVAPGRLTLSARLASENFIYEPLLWPTLSVDAALPSNYVVLIVRQPTGCISGTISNAPALGLQPQVSSSAQLNGTNYLITGCADGAGYYCLPAVPGVWTVSIADGSLADFGIQSLAPALVTVPIAGPAPPVDFGLRPITGDYREARFLKPLLLPSGALRLELRGQTALSWRLERGDNLLDWTPVALETTINGSFGVEEPRKPSSLATFYRAVWVR